MKVLAVLWGRIRLELARAQARRILRRAWGSQLGARTGLPVAVVAVLAVALGRWLDRRLTALEDEVLSSARARGELERLFIREHPYAVAVAEAERILREDGDDR